MAFPECSNQVAELLALAKSYDLEVIPYGGGTSVAGHINPKASKRPVLTVSLERMNRLLDLDVTSQIATFGAGTPGPLWSSSCALRVLPLGIFRSPLSFQR